MLNSSQLLDIIPSHQVAVWMTSHIKNLLNHLGLEHDKTLEEVIYVAAIVLFALLLGWVIRRIILWGTRKLVALKNTRFTNELLQQKVLTRCSHIIPPLVILSLLPFAFDSSSALLSLFKTLVVIYLIITITMAINKIVTFIWLRYNERENTKNLPLAGIHNVMVGIVWIISIIVIGSVILDKSPMALLGGLGAFATVLMLIFKDSILGFVAGIQLSQNDMIRIGDWIVVPSTIANGIVVDMSLTAVKVQNWDNTIVTLPPYTLVSTSFQNWRGMTDSRGRRVNRAVTIDVDSVDFCTDEMIAAFRQEEWWGDLDPEMRHVNLTVFRRYLEHYISQLPDLKSSPEMVYMVRELAPTPNGIPLELYLFTSVTSWKPYEHFQAAVIDHVLASVHRFGLRIYQAPSGRDIALLAGARQ